MGEKPEWMRTHGRPWTRGAGRTVYDNPWISVTEFQATAPTGNPALYGLVGYKNRALAILPLFEDGTVLMVGQNRLPFADYSWEIPEGGGPLDQDPLAGAQRELLEETGFMAGTWQEVMRLQLSNSVSDELAICYLATDLQPGGGTAHGDDTEDLVKVRAPFREVMEAAMSGYITDSLTVAMLLRVYHMAHKGSLPEGLAQIVLG